MKKKSVKIDSASSPDMVATILKGGTLADELMCHILYNQLNHKLRKTYEPYRRQLPDSYEDLIGDYFLYLRDGKEGQTQVPYTSLHSIVRRDSLETWLLHTFRNFLSTRAALQPPLEEPLPRAYHTPEDCSEESKLSDEWKLNLISTLIAYALQTLSPRDRFLFLRSLLTLLDKSLALPNREVAEVLGMSNVAYRVATSRVKSHITALRDCLLKGMRLPMDATHRQLVMQINAHPNQLYSLLLVCYHQTVGELPYADNIRQLLQRHARTIGDMCHEPDPYYHESVFIETIFTFFFHQLAFVSDF